MAYTPFKAMEAKLAQRPGVTNPGGLTAYIANRAYGKKAVQHAAATGTSLRGKPKRKKPAGQPHPQSFAAMVAKRHGK